MIRLFKSRFRIASIMLGLVLLIGIIGFRYITGVPWLDAVYMTAITVSTVGYGEVVPLDPQAKAFTIFLISSSALTFAYSVSVITEYLINKNSFEQIKRKRMKKKISGLKNHVIICGYGRNGKQAAQKLRVHNKPFVIIEKNKELIEKYEDEALFVYGNANEDETLINAGIEQAHSIIVAMPNDADNLYVVLSARQINSELVIISRASQETSYNKLKLAGANNVIMPDKIGGDHMASLVVIPDLVEFLDNLSIIGDDTVNIEEVAIEDIDDTGQSRTIKDLDLRNKTGCTIIGYKTPGGKYLINPEADTQLDPNSKLIVLGRAEQIIKLNKMFNL